MILNDMFSKVQAVLTSQLSGITAMMGQVQNISQMIAQKTQQVLQKFIQGFTKTPKTKEDYFRFGDLYIAKKLLFIVIAGTVGIGYFAVTYAYPWANGRIWTANVYTDSENYSKFSGKANVYDTMGVKIYSGQMENGKPNGYGTQYTRDGVLLYEGNFESGDRSGEGTLYNGDGVAIYEGAFANNQYDGKGVLYNDIGKPIYSGEFKAGQCSGLGTEYDPVSELKLYYGEFANGARQGKGVAFDTDGITTLYEGDFSAGNYEGKGKLYQNGNLRYSGDFMAGVFSGSGELYDLETGVLQYSGEFKNGLYDGTGKLYDINTSVVVYEGSFTAGKKQGDGASYDAMGSMTFEGTFRSDSIDYINYLGSSVDDVVGQFGPESYRSEQDNKLMLTYLSLDATIVFKVDSEKGEYVCEKVVLGTKDEFMGLGAQSTSVERREVMGEPFTSIDYSCPSYYGTIFSNLGISINDLTKVPSDKYIMGNYFIRFYFNEGRTELKCIEICTM